MGPFAQVIQRLIEKSADKTLFIALNSDPDVDHNKYTGIPGFAVVPMRLVVATHGAIWFRENYLGLIVTEYDPGKWAPFSPGGKESWRQQPNWLIQDWIVETVRKERMRDKTFAVVVLSKGLPDPLFFTDSRFPFNDLFTSCVFPDHSGVWSLTPDSESVPAWIKTIEPTDGNPWMQIWTTNND
jgi:hypothetical protein